MKVTKTRCKQFHIILTAKEAEVLRKLSYSHIEGNTTIDCTPFAYLKFVDLTEKEKELSVAGRALFDNFASYLMAED